MNGSVNRDVGWLQVLGQYNQLMLNDNSDRYHPKDDTKDTLWNNHTPSIQVIAWHESFETKYLCGYITKNLSI